MSLYTAAVLLCLLSLTAAANDLGGVRDGLSAQPSARSLLAKYSKNKKTDDSTVLTLDLSVNEGTAYVVARGGSKGRSGRRGARKSTTPKSSPSAFRSTAPKSSPSAFSFDDSSEKSSFNLSPIRSRPRSTRFGSRHTRHVPSRHVPAPGHTQYYGFYTEVDLNKATTEVTRLVEEEELPKGEKDLNHGGYRSASKSHYHELTPKAAPKYTPKASASTSFTGVGVVQGSSVVSVGERRSLKPKKTRRVGLSNRRSKKPGRGFRGSLG